jgi:hypothetical protein
MIINVADHYWIIGGSATEVYQSKTNTLVALDNADYASWAANEVNTATKIISEAELGEVLRTYGSPLPAWLLATEPTFIQPTLSTYTDEQLASYTADARRRKQSSDIVVNGQPFATDPITLGSLNSAYIYTQTNAGATFSWKLPDGSFITLAKADVQQLQGAVSSYGQACFACEDETLTGIENGSITTLEQIDAAFAAVSNSFTGLRDAEELRHRHGPKKTPKAAAKKK